jgi:MOSC domain-containing protein YiiM
MALRGVNLHGDDQADPNVHGGPDKAVYAYAVEDTEWWEAQLGAGAFGENLTVHGIPVSEAVIGERWLGGSAVREVAQPRLPCFKLGLRMGDPRFLKRVAAADRPGAYLRVVSEGDIGAGDQIDVIKSSHPSGDERARLASPPARAAAVGRCAAGARARRRRARLDAGAHRETGRTGRLPAQSATAFALAQAMMAALPLTVVPSRNSSTGSFS